MAVTAVAVHDAIPARLDESIPIKLSPATT